jgi:hypothetical protein
MSFTKMAQELIDHVLDFLCDDKQGLLSCSLVCKAWLCRARSHIFRLQLKPDIVVPFIRSASGVIAVNAVDVFGAIQDEELAEGKSNDIVSIKGRSEEV